MRVIVGSPASIGDTGQYMAVTDDGTIYAFGRTERIARRRLRQKARRHDWRDDWHDARR